MATYEQVMDALRQADAAGNVDDARQLAVMAIRLRPQDTLGDLGLKTAPTPATSTGQYFMESAKRGLSSLPARLGAGSAQQTGTFAGAFPTQPELEEFTTPNIQRRMGVDVDLRPTTQTQKYAGAAVEAMTDPLNLLGLPVTGPARAALITGAGMAGAGGEFGGEVGGQVAGVPGQITGGILFALLSGAGGVKGAEALFSKGKGVNLKDFKVEDLAGVEGNSVAKDLIDKALASDPGLNARLQDIKKKIDFVGGESNVLASAGVDNKVLRAALTRLAQNDPKVAADLQKVYSDLQTAVRSKASGLYPQPTGVIPSVGKATGQIEIDYNKRLAAISDQQAKLGQTLNLMGDAAPVDLGKSIQNLTLAQEAAARKALSPDYDSVKAQASAMGAILPAVQTQSLLDTAKDLFMQDPWGRQSSLLKLVQKQAGEFEKLRTRSGAAPTDQTLIGADGQNLPTSVDNLSAGLDITSLDSLKRRVAEDIRTIRSDSTRDKLILLQQRVDDALNQVQSSSGDVKVNFRGESTTFGDAMQRLDLDYYTKVGIPFKDADAVQKIGGQEYAERIAPQLASSPTSMSQFLRIAGDEGAPLAEKAVMSKLYAQSLDKDGFIDPNKLDALLNKTSNNGGYSDILTQLPNLQAKLADATQRADFLSSQRVAIDDAAKAERVRIGDSFLADYDRGGVEAITARMLGANGIGYQAKFFNDLKKLSPDDQTNATLAVRNALVGKMLDSKNPFDFLNKNKLAYNKVFGADHVSNLAAMADVARLAGKIDVERLPLNDIAIKQMSAMQRLLGGVDPKKVSAVLVNQISSVFNKGFRIAAAIGQENIDQATKDAQRKLFLDKNGLDNTIKATTRLISKSGQEVDLKGFIKPEDLSNLAKSFGMNLLRTGYLGGSTAASESEVMSDQPESFYEYTPQE